MTGGQKAMAVLGGAAPRAIDRFLQIRDFMNREQSMGFNQQIEQDKLAHQRNILGKDLLNVGLRGGELDHSINVESGRNRRFDAGQTMDMFKTFGGGAAQIGRNPTGYGAGLGALQQGNAEEFVRRMGEAQMGSAAAQVQQSARMAGAGQSARSRAASEQQRRDAEEVFQTRRLESGEINQLPPGLQPRRDIRRGGKTQDELAADSQRRLGEDAVKFVRRMVAKGEAVPFGAAQEAVQHMLSTNPRLKAEYDAGDEAMREEIEFQIIDRLGATEYLEGAPE